MIPTLLVGLGNDEKKYHDTLHNIGFRALDDLARRLKCSWKEQKGKVWVATTETTRLVKPRSYMNVSGEVVGVVAGGWRVPASGVLVVCDDFSLPWGKLRFRSRGSAGGHNGLDSVIRAFRTEDVARLRVGVGPVPPGLDPKDFVLSRIDADRLDVLAAQAADALQAVLTDGLVAAMNLFNGRPG